MKVYYAHPVSLYGKPQEERDIQTLLALGFEVVNPNTPQMNKDYYERGMAAFEDVIGDCDALAFRAFPDGLIPAGVAKEIEWARTYGKPFFELPTRLLARVLSVEQTRETLREIGER